MKREMLRNSKGWLVSYDGRQVIPADLLPENTERPGYHYCINLKGCNGSGKSTVVFEMLRTGNWVYITTEAHQKKPIAIYSRKYNTVILGTYMSQCGGCDTLSNTKVVAELLKLFWDKDVNVLYEGVIVGDIKSTFYELMKELRERYYRHVSFCFMGTTIRECLARVQKRNGGKEVNENLIRGKYATSIRQLKWYLEQGDVECTVLDTKHPKNVVFRKFLELYSLGELTCF